MARWWCALTKEAVRRTRLGLTAVVAFDMEDVENMAQKLWRTVAVDLTVVAVVVIVVAEVVPAA